MGGDEFVVLVDGATMEAGPKLVAERLLTVSESRSSSRACPTGPDPHGQYGAAAGNKTVSTELLRDAEIALYQAQAARRGCFVVFRPRITAVQDRLLLEMDLRVARAPGANIFWSTADFELASGRPTAWRRCCAGGVPSWGRAA